MATDALSVFQALNDYFFRYYATPFAVADDSVERERERLLNRDGVVWREPWIEPLREFERAGRSLEESCSAVGSHPDLAAFARARLIPVNDLDMATGIYASLSRWGENVLRYRPDSINGTLVVPLGAPLPTLQARSAALCSGLAPQLQAAALAQWNVPQEVAERIARSLDQTLIIE